MASPRLSERRHLTGRRAERRSRASEIFLWPSLTGKGTGPHHHPTPSHNQRARVYCYNMKHIIHNFPFSSYSRKQVPITVMHMLHMRKWRYSGLPKGSYSVTPMTVSQPTCKPSHLALCLLTSHPKLPGSLDKPGSSSSPLPQEVPIQVYSVAQVRQ